MWNVLRDIKLGFYIDVGANDPIKFSVTKSFYDRGWSGINIEPLKACYNELVLERTRDINENCAVSNEAGVLEYYESYPDNMFSTFDKSIIPNYIKKGMKFEKTQVEVKTLNQILEVHRSKFIDIHFLKIDVEGFEEQVIKGIDLLKYRPWIISIEISISKDLTYLKILEESGYILAFSDNLNLYYLAKEHTSLKSRFNEDISGKYLVYKVRNLDDYNNELESIRNAYMNSISWRLTKPIRGIKKLFLNIKSYKYSKR